MLPSTVLALPQLGDEAADALSPEPDRNAVDIHIYPLDEELNDARLLGGKEFVRATTFQVRPSW